MLSRRSRGGAVRTMVEGLMAVYSTAGSVTTRCPALTRRGASLVGGASCRASWQTATMGRGCRRVDVRGHGEQGCHEVYRLAIASSRARICRFAAVGFFSCSASRRLMSRSCGLAGWWAARLARLTNSGGLGPRSARNRSLALMAASSGCVLPQPRLFFLQAGLRGVSTTSPSSSSVRVRLCAPLWGGALRAPCGALPEVSS